MISLSSGSRACCGRGTIVLVDNSAMGLVYTLWVVEMHEDEKEKEDHHTDNHMTVTMQSCNSDLVIKQSLLP